MNYRNLSATAWLALMLLSSSLHADENPLVLNVWPGKAPGETGEFGPEGLLEPKPGEKKVDRLANVTVPTLTVYAPPKDKQNGTSVVICPGGGYHILAMDLEGTEVAAWLNKHGVTAFVLKYRVPRRPNQEAHAAPLKDAQRAISLVRSQAKQLNIDPDKIGILGFSAGGHLAAATCLSESPRTYEKVDAVDEASSRPNFAVLIYPGYLVNKEGTELSPELKVTKDAPPTFLAHAGDDPVTPLSSVLLYAALKRANVPAELHVYASGGHGYGLRDDNPTAKNWPLRCEEWLRGRKLIP